jgi:tRNA U55 pseudouridine synthase TruB
MYLEYKEAGLTMDQFINLIKHKYKHSKYAYTARLDPMARGVIPVLVDDECLDIKKHLSSNKIYNVKIILGIQTDSDDPLGIIQKISLIDDFDSFLIKNTDHFLINDKTFDQKFHYFSTKALHMRKHYRHEDSYHSVQIFQSNILSTGFIKFTDWKEEIIETINKIDNKKNFRQDDIINQWKLKDFDKLPFIELQLKVSSGFFVRQFVRDISIKLNQPMFAYDIYRKDIL